MKENYMKVLELCKVLIEQDYAPCGLEDDLRKRLLELTLEWEKRKAKADGEGRGIGGVNVIFTDVFRAVWKAKSDEERFGKPKCYYLERGLKKQLGESGTLGTWSYSMWG